MLSDQETAPIEGTHDLLPPLLAGSIQLRALLQDFLSSYGYAPVELPLIERTGLYLRKLGSRVAGSMFNLTDQRGERLSLRPELTASAIRAFINERSGLALPVRWQYCGPVFRDRETPGRPRQFTQLGAELIGAGAPRADAELLAVACAGLQAVGIARPRLVLGHAGLIPSLLEQLPLSERARMYLAGHLDLLRRGVEGIAELRRGLEERQLSGGPLEGRHLALGDAESEEATNLVGWLLSEGATRSTGRRNTEQIVHRFRAKLHGPDDPAELDRALAVAGEIAQVRATPLIALETGRSIAGRHGLDLAPLAELQVIVSLLNAYQLSNVSVEVDLGLTRALGYYTGIVFEAFGGEPTTPIAGGGRYDGLVRALGGNEDLPALGFAYALEDLEAAIPHREPGPQRGAVLVVPQSDAAMAGAVSYMNGLRAAGQDSVLEVIDRAPAERLAYCAEAGINRIALVGPSGVEEQDAAERTYAPAGAS